MLPTPGQTRPASTPTAPRPPRHARQLRAIFGGAAVAGILTGAIGCDKRAAGEPVVVHLTSLAGKPTMLFLLFGERQDPRLLPLAMAAQGRIVPVTLDIKGWRHFDELYFAPGAAVPIYRDGRQVAAQAKVRRGMWSEADPLYKLPGCRSLRPLAAVTADNLGGEQPVVELLATSAPLPLSPSRPVPDSTVLDSARALAARAAEQEKIGRTDRGDLNLAVRAIQTGATSKPTLLGSYMERGTAAVPRPRHLFMLADSTSAGYATSFLHVARDSVAEFRRLIDHLDLDGDGVDEIVLEGWRNGGDSFLSILRFSVGQWKEVARSATSWCGDPPRPESKYDRLLPKSSD